MATPNTQHPSPETTYSTASNAGKDPLKEENKPLRDDFDEENEEFDDEDEDEQETQKKEWK